MNIAQASLLAVTLTLATPVLAQNPGPTTPPAATRVETPTATRVETKDNDFDMGWLGLLGLLGLAGLMGKNRRHEAVSVANPRVH